MLEPLTYHRAVRGELLRYYPTVWKAFSSDAYKAQHAEQLRLSLLKRTYRLDPESHPDLHATARLAAEKLGVTVPIELYQGPDQGVLNASLYFVPEAARLVLFGAIDRLAPDELLALMGHELAHHVLYTRDFGDFLTAARVLDAMAEAADSSSVQATARLYQLSTEIYADRGSVAATGDSEAAIRCLLKTETGVPNPDARAFSRQVEEVLARDSGGSATHSHPETYLRAKALSLYEAPGAADLDAKVHRLIEGPVQLDTLDLLRRRELTDLTRRLLDLFFAPAWSHLPGLLQAAQMLFDDYQPPSEPADDAAAALVEALAPYGESVWDYVAYVLTDLVACDPNLGLLPLARAQVVAEALGQRERLEGHVNKELRVIKRDIAQTYADRERLFTAAAEPEAGDG